MNSIPPFFQPPFAGPPSPELEEIQNKSTLIRPLREIKGILSDQKFSSEAENLIEKVLSHPNIETDEIQFELADITSSAFFQSQESIYCKTVPFLNQIGIIHAFSGILDLHLKEKVQSFPYPWRLWGVAELLDHPKTGPLILMDFLKSSSLYKFPNVLWQILRHPLIPSLITDPKIKEISDTIETYEKLILNTVEQIQKTRDDFEHDLEKFPDEREAFKTASNKTLKRVSQLKKLIFLLKAEIKKIQNLRGC